MMKRLSLALVLLTCLAVTAAAVSAWSAATRGPGTTYVQRADNHWNQFRGPNGDGKSLAENVPVEFGETKNVRWKTPIHDEGWSSPVVWGNQVWLTTGRLEGSGPIAKKGKARSQKKTGGGTAKKPEVGKQELVEAMRAKGMSDEEIREWFAKSQTKPGKKGIAASGQKKDTAKPSKRNGGKLELFAVCVDLRTGKVIHDIKVFDVPEPQLENPGLNTHATPTPVVEEGRVYVSYGTYGTACLDTRTGKKLWERRDLNCDHRVRPGSSPIVDGDSIYLHLDGVDAQFVAALDKRTGGTRWIEKRKVDSDLGDTMRALGFSESDIEDTKKKKPNDNRKSYATPTIIAYQGKRQLVSPAAEATFSYDPDTGAELWRVRHPGMGWNLACRPIFENGLVYSFTGISRHLMAVRPSGTGDVTETHVDWIAKGKNIPAIPSPLIVDDLMFLVTDEGFASCLEVKTGRRLWRNRLRAGGPHWASPVYADGNIYFTGKRGVVSVVAAAREFQLLAENKFDASFNASPAVAGDAIILRSLTDLYCIGEPSEAK